MRELASLVSGDKVFVSCGGWGATKRVAVVEKITKQHIIVDGKKFRKLSGSKVVPGGRYFGGESITVYDEAEWQEHLAKNRERDMVNRLRNYDWSRCDKELICKIHELLPTAVKP